MSFFLPSIIFLNFSKFLISTQKNAMKTRGHRARSRAKKHCTCLHGLFIEKQYHVLGMRALICLIT